MGGGGCIRAGREEKREAVVEYALCHVYPSPWEKVALMRVGWYAA